MKFSIFGPILSQLTELFYQRAKLREHLSDFVKTRLNICNAKQLYVDIAVGFVRCKRLFIRRPSVLSLSRLCLLYNNLIN